MMGFTELVASVNAGEYRPTPGTIGARLLTNQCTWHAARSLAVFAKAALRSEGTWWVVTLESTPDQLSDEDKLYVRETWKVWVSGRRPFRVSKSVLVDA